MKSSSQALAHSSFRPILRRFLPLFLPLALICIGGAAFWIQSEVELELQKTRSSESAVVNVGITEGVDSIRRELQLITNDLALLA